jgi:hypothetical protein
MPDSDVHSLNEQLLVTTRHEICGKPLIAYPAVVHSVGMVVLLGGNIGIPYKTGILEKETEGIFFECLEETCPDTEWTFIPFLLSELIYLGVKVEETSGMPLLIFKMPDSTGAEILLPGEPANSLQTISEATEGNLNDGN